MDKSGISEFKKIIRVLKEHKEEIRQRYQVKEIGIFGSYVRKENTKESDIDILVEFEENAKIGLLKFVNLENYLSELIEKKVDLVEKTSLKPRISKQILNEVIFL